MNSSFESQSEILHVVDDQDFSQISELTRIIKCPKSRVKRYSDTSEGDLQSDF
jgi:hypothetical protein